MPTDLRRHLHAGAPAHRRRGRRPRRGAGGLPAGLPGTEAVPGRRPVHDLAVPDHRQLRLDLRWASGAGTATTSSTTTWSWSTTRPDHDPAALADAADLRARAGGRPRRAAAPAAGGRRAARRLRPAPRGHRRRAGDLRVGGQGPAAPGPAQAARGGVPRPGATSRTRSRPMRCDDIGEVLAGDRRRRRSRSTTPPASHVEQCLRCQAELVQYRKLLRALRTLRDRGARAGARPRSPRSWPTSRRPASATPSARC